MTIMAGSHPHSQTVLPIGIGEYGVTVSPQQQLIAYGLGSCVALCLWDAARHTAGMAHIMLPKAPSTQAAPQSAKFADLAILALLASLDPSRTRRSHLVAKIAGGAQMFTQLVQPAMMTIGQRNVESLKSLLHAHHIPLVAEDTGGRAGRTVSFDPSTGTMCVKMVGHSEKVL